MQKSEYRWPLQEAKNKFSQVAEEAALYGPQVVTKRGRDAVVIISVEDYERLSQPRQDLASFLKHSPLSDVDLDIDRDRDPGREVDL